MWINGLNLHWGHDCKICGLPCGWCESCGFAHCFNGHEHEGFMGWMKKPTEKELQLLKSGKDCHKIEEYLIKEE